MNLQNLKFSENMRNMGSIPVVRIAGNRTDPDIETGMTKPPLFCVEYSDSVNILLDAKDSINPASDNPFNFSVDLKANLYRCRSIKVTKVICPKINNITPFNNQIVIKHALGTTNTMTMTPGLYNTTTLSNEITKVINAGFLAAGIADTVTTVYDPVAKTFSISSVGGLNFFIVNTCNFITRGKYLAGFESQPLADVPTKNIIYSSMAGMLYTRYITVHSSKLTYYSYGDALTSNILQGGDIIAIVNTSDMYNTGDWDIGTQFSGNYATIQTDDASQVNLINTQKNLDSIVDISTRDEWQQNLNQVMVNGNGASNTLGITIFLKVLF
jgi:hypothetical protein